MMMDKKQLWVIFPVFFAFLLILLGLMLFQPANLFDRESRLVLIPQGSSGYTVQQILENQGLLRPHSSFSFLARILGVSTNIKAGLYSFAPNQSLWTVLIKLKKGQVIPLEQISVTFPEGSSIYKMGEILKVVNVATAIRFQALTKNGINESLRNSHWEIFKYIPSESLEGYLYPDTYMFFTNASVSEIAEKMLNRFEQQVLPFWRRANKDTKWTLHEILTIASIVEKEAKVPSERPVIASVFYNRLKAGMPLAADPTIKYALEQPTKKVYLNQLEVDSPYNTYKKRGLPPGPICNPGIESIKAAVYPAKTNYYFFVAKPDGSHIFSATWVEHQKARGAVKN